MNKIVVLLLVSFSFALTALSTPERAVWENETLIGVNDQYFYTTKICKYLTGTYYHGIDSVFLIERGLNTGKVTERIVLRVIEHTDTTTNGDWQHNEMIENPTNIIEYQKRKRIELLFQSNYENSKFKFTTGGLILVTKNSEALIANNAYVEKFVPWFNQYLNYQEKYHNDYGFQIRVSQIFESRTHLFLVVESGLDHTDGDFRQTVLVIHRDSYNAARRQ